MSFTEDEIEQIIRDSKTHKASYAEYALKMFESFDTNTLAAIAAFGEMEKLITGAMELSPDIRAICLAAAINRSGSAYKSSIAGLRQLGRHLNSHGLRKVEANMRVVAKLLRDAADNFETSTTN